MSIEFLSTNWLLYKTLMNTALLGQGDRSKNSELTSNSFETLLAQTLMQANISNKTASNLDASSLLFSSLNSFNYTSPGGDTVSSSTTPNKTRNTLTSDFEASALNSQLKGVLQNAGDLFAEAGKKYQINPAFLAAISMHETGNGTSNAARFKYNVAGMMGKDGLKSYASIEDSIFDMARNLRQNYLDEGKLTISQIGAKYAPIGANNDPRQLNNHWVQGVQRNFSTLTEKADLT